MATTGTNSDFRRKTQTLAAPLQNSGIRECYGTSNSAKFVTGGFLCGIPNLDNLDESVGALCVFSRIQLGPESELHTAILIRHDLKTLLLRLKTMVSNPVNESFGIRNQNCAIFLAADGMLYPHNKAKDTFALTEEVLTQLGPGVVPDALYWTIYGNDTEATRGTVSQLEKLIGREKLYMIETKAVTLPLPVIIGNQTVLPKPFLLLAGISGTGKTRFVREQAKESAGFFAVAERENHCLVPVRPDWHEPSDLLGYISRIGNGGTRYVTTELLRFIVAAWKHAAESATATQITRKPLDTICPFWLCLDEMNLAPVEQYFADYLSILETRTWDGETYSCDPLLKPAVIQQQLEEAGRKDLWGNLGIADDDPLSVGLRKYFSANGIPLPPNLIVAGTVNMDETTHGFSRKVIDRALTIDFGEFFPNDYDQYFEDDKKTAVKPLSFPRLSQINKGSDLAAVAADPDGRNTIAFLSAVNEVLSGTPFVLAFRALNEALLSVACFNPADSAHLQAVWDDYLMMKVLPRIEGDAEKLCSQDDASLLTRLSDLLKVQLSEIAADRLDLLNHSSADGTPVKTTCRSLKKLAWMQKRLDANGFTTFWP